MRIDIEVVVLRVFCSADGEGGNPLGVVMDGGAVAEDDRQAIAGHLGYAETVFVEDTQHGRIRIYTPTQELPLTGHPLVGTGWLLAREGYPADALHTPAGAVTLRHEGELTWASARPEWCPPFELVELPSPAEVEAQEASGAGWYYVWAWIDEPRGLIRSRCFVPEAGIPEDEATGSAALRLCAELGRPIDVHQGAGSLIHATPAADGFVEIGGRVERA
jgi:predicted PhzF superfamily epimerase YddE/YHI9